MPTRAYQRCTSIPNWKIHPASRPNWAQRNQILEKIRLLHSHGLHNELYNIVHVYLNGISTSHGVSHVGSVRNAFVQFRSFAVVHPLVCPYRLSFTHIPHHSFGFERATRSYPLQFVRVPTPHVCVRRPFQPYPLRGVFVHPRPFRTQERTPVDRSHDPRTSAQANKPSRFAFTPSGPLPHRNARQMNSRGHECPCWHACGRKGG
jgi:hypothetical protein